MMGIQQSPSNSADMGINFTRHIEKIEVNLVGFLQNGIYYSRKSAGLV